MVQTVEQLKEQFPDVPEHFIRCIRKGFRNKEKISKIELNIDKIERQNHTAFFAFSYGARALRSYTRPDHPDRVYFKAYVIRTWWHLY